MNKDKQAQLEVENKIEALNDMLDKLFLMKGGTHRVQAGEQIKKKITEINKALNGLNDQFYKTKKLKDAFENMVENFKELQEEAKHEEEKGESSSPTAFESEEFDPEVDRKRRELEDLKELNKLSTEMVLKQNLINQKMKEDSDNIDSLVVDTDNTAHSGNNALKNIADASKSERRKRLFVLQAGGTVAGGLLGNVFGAVGGLFITNGISRWMGKKHQKKLDEVIKM